VLLPCQPRPPHTSARGPTLRALGARDGGLVWDDALRSGTSTCNSHSFVRGVERAELGGAHLGARPVGGPDVRRPVVPPVRGRRVDIVCSRLPSPPRGPSPCGPTRSDRGKSTTEDSFRLGRQRADGLGWSFFLARWPHVFSLLLLVIGVSAEQLVDTGWLPGWRSEHPPHALTRKMQEGRFGWSAGSGHSDSSGVRNRKPGGFHGVNQTRRS
jgi:hypothetical protein